MRSFVKDRQQAGRTLFRAPVLSLPVAGPSFGVTPNDPVLLASVAVLLAVTSTAASLVPAWRASRIDPGPALSAD